MDLTAFGRTILIIAVVLAVVGLLMVLLGKVAGGRGWLPGDIVYRRDGVTIFFPIVTSIVISIILSLILSLIIRLIHRGR